MVGSSFYNDNESFLQNLNAAREVALISRLNRAIETMNKFKSSLQGLKTDTREYRNLEQSLLDERTRYYQVLNQLNRVRGIKTLQTRDDVVELPRQQIRFVSDRNLYTMASIIQGKKKNGLKEDNQFQGFFTEDSSNSRAKVLDTMVF